MRDTHTPTPFVREAKGEQGEQGDERVASSSPPWRDARYWLRRERDGSNDLASSGDWQRLADASIGEDSVV